jgi:SAM-dependent methyltransferase
MPRLPERAIATAPQAPAIDFMRRAYELNGEPLRLLDQGQRWFEGVMSNDTEMRRRSSALALGATPWLVELLSRKCLRTTVVDASAAMLELCTSTRSTTGRVDTIQCNWLDMPASSTDFDVVVGDNAFSFLRCPDQWERLLDILAERVAPNGRVLSRLLVIPTGHCRSHPADLVRDVLARRTPVNFTALRVALLLAHWDAADWTIVPEEALATFDSHRAEFDPLLCDVANIAANDLLTIEKYRGTAVTYFVPPLEQAIALFERRFRVRAVHFGPYDMSEYFPLIVASKQPM